MISDIVANLQASEAANDAAVTQAIADLQALPTGGTPVNTLPSSVVFNFPDGTSQTGNVTAA
jgi:hypothetical protein